MLLQMCFAFLGWCCQILAAVGNAKGKDSHWNANLWSSLEGYIIRFNTTSGHCWSGIQNGENIQTMAVIVVAGVNYFITAFSKFC